MDNSSQTPVTQVVAPNIPPVNRTVPPKKPTWLIVLVGLILLTVVGTSAYWLGTRTKKVAEEPGQPTATTTPTNTAASQTTQPLFSGKLTRLTQNLKLFKTTEDDRLNNIENDFVYYSAGKFLKGDLKDYTRIVAIRQPMGPTAAAAYLLATKDFQTFVLDDPDNLTTKYPEDDWQNPFNLLDKSKVTSAQKFDTEQPQNISLNQDFALFFQSYPVGNIATNKKDKNGNIVYDTPLLIDFSTSHKLTSPVEGLDFYAKPNPVSQSINLLKGDDKKAAELSAQYLLGSTEVTVVDSTGLPKIYVLTTPAAIQNYLTQKTKFEADWKVYQTELDKYNKHEISQYPTTPSYVSLPHLVITKKELKTQGNVNTFSDYELAFPGACAMTVSTQIANVQDTDLTQIGTTNGLAVYKLKDDNHSLNFLEYRNKLGYYLVDKQSWDGMNKGRKMPTQAEYVNQTPLLFVQDYWKRWVALGEYDIKLVGGCGKPVVYLYPTKPTEVSVKFQAPMQFTTDIPTYSDGWRVLAQPNGQLTDLQPALTDCTQIDNSKVGSEYAKAACATHTYPYLYWAGSVTSNTYPTTDKGWVVAQNELDNFINEKLTEMGLNNTEIKDFSEYWLPSMLRKNAPYYKLSFMQTSELNRMFPMSVTPTPDTTFRIFMDYTPLIEKPVVTPEPQTLNKLVRHGFTLVEWGGLKR